MNNKLYNEYKAEWEKLFTLGTPRTYKAGEILYMQGTPSVGIICLKSGIIRNCVYFPNGREKTLCLLEAPALTGETAFVDKDPSICSAVAQTDVEVVEISDATAEKYLYDDPQALRLMLLFFARKIRSMTMQSESGVLSIPQKLARMLVNFRKYGIFANEDDRILTCTHEQLANFLDTTRPKITEALNDFEQQGIIKKTRGYIKILDMQALKDIYE